MTERLHGERLQQEQRKGKTQQVGKGSERERDGSNWIHRFLRN